jgi:hypothetical protein
VRHFLIFIIMLLLITSLSCTKPDPLADPPGSETVIETPVDPVDETPLNKTDPEDMIKFNETGISFTYPAYLATELVTEYIEGDPDCDFLPFPDYLKIEFNDYIHAEAFTTPAIMLFLPDEYSLVMEFAALQIDTLENIILNQAGLEEAEELPFLPVWNAAQHFNSNALLLNFKNGKGIRYLTQYVQDTSPVTNEHLFYTFQGLTDDGLSYVAFTIPVTHPDLPAGWDDFFKGTDGNIETYGVNYQQYLEETISMLDETDDNKFSPSLQVLDDIVKSLTVE